MYVDNDEANGKWVLMDEDRHCIVKGRSKKYVVGINEETRKEIVYYKSEVTARCALRRSFILCSDYVTQIYGEIGRNRLIPVFTGDGDIAMSACVIGCVQCNQNNG